jgi:hypothetical protein
VARRPPIAVLASLAVLFATPGQLYAFCRTTTEQVPSGYDPAAKGCWSHGTPIAWTAGPVPYSVAASASRQIPLSDARRVAHLAFQAWNDATCLEGQPNVQAYDNGPASEDAAAADCGLTKCDPTFHDPQHIIVFRDDRWPYEDPANTLALTTVTFGVDSAEIFDADIEINSAQHTLSAQEPPPRGAFDLQAILTHEAGHFFGLAHSTNSGAVMYAFYEMGAIALTSDDVAGICSVYAPLAAGLGCASPRCAAAPGGAETALGSGAASLGLALVSAFRWRTRLLRWKRRARSAGPTATRRRAGRSPRSS